MWKTWKIFVTSHSGLINLYAPAELHVCLWLVFLKSKGLAASTIRGYLYTLSSEVKKRGGSAIIIPRASWFIHATLKAINRVTPCKTLSFRRPITVPVLVRFLSALNFSVGDDLLYGAMVTTGVFGLFRINELCAVKIAGKLKCIKNEDVIFQKDHAQIKLRSTKTKDHVVKVLADIKDTKANPCGLLWSYSLTRTSSAKPDGPFFIDQYGKGVTRIMLIKFIRSILGKVFPNINPKEWNGASLRKGGATSAVRAGVQTDIIEKLGHWDSNAYKKYVHCSIDDLTKAQVQCAVAQSNPDDIYL